MPPLKIAILLGLIISLVGCHNGGQEKPAGLRLLEVHGCLACHSLDGSKKIGPSLQGLCGREIAVITDGVKRTITVDRDYLLRSILDPQADVVDGFAPGMPTNFKTQLGEDKLNTILDFLASISDDQSKSCVKETSAGASTPNMR